MAASASRSATASPSPASIRSRRSSTSRCLSLRRSSMARGRSAAHTSTSSSSLPAARERPNRSRKVSTRGGGKRCSSSCARQLSLTVSQQRVPRRKPRPSMRVGLAPALAQRAARAWQARYVVIVSMRSSAVSCSACGCSSAHCGGGGSTWELMALRRALPHEVTMARSPAPFGAAALSAAVACDATTREMSDLTASLITGFSACSAATTASISSSSECCMGVLLGAESAKRHRSPVTRAPPTSASR
mmetsp:Transcript_41798/g.135600  ORF Transcript_41798/g.135600 Transcript_41798/m.135600 type:complete len:247 (-) Transcript_41798:21-761(-)